MSYLSRGDGTVDVADSKSAEHSLVRVRFSPAAHFDTANQTYKLNWAYVVGLAIGDGNLSNPNGRAIRLRISCDAKYPKLIETIMNALKILLPHNVVNTIVRPRNCVDVYVFSNLLEELLGWKAKGGPKFKQHVRVPDWIKNNKEYSILCLRGLFQTDGSIYNDRGYVMTQFVTIIPELAEDVMTMITNLGFKPHLYKIQHLPVKQDRYNIRISKNTQAFIDLTGLVKD